MSPNTSPGVDPAGVAPALVHSDSKAGHGGPANARVPGDPGRKHTQEQLRVIVAGESGLGKTTFLNNIFRHLNRGENPMDQAAVVQARGGGMFGHGKTLTIEERSFKYKTHEEDEYEFFLVLEGWDRILEAADSGEEHLDVLLDVLMEYYKNTANIKAQVSFPDAGGTTLRRSMQGPKRRQKLARKQQQRKQQHQN